MIISKLKYLVFSFVFLLSHCFGLENEVFKFEGSGSLGNIQIERDFPIADTFNNSATVSSERILDIPNYVKRFPALIIKATGPLSVGNIDTPGWYIYCSTINGNIDITGNISRAASVEKVD